MLRQCLLLHQGWLSVYNGRGDDGNSSSQFLHSAYSALGTCLHVLANFMDEGQRLGGAKHALPAGLEQVLEPKGLIRAPPVVPGSRKQGPGLSGSLLQP